MRFNRTDWLIIPVLALATAGLFWQAVGFEFVHYDDPEYVFMNDQVKNGLTSDNLKFAFTSRTLSHWHPLTWLSLMLDAQLSGLAPAGFHRTNVILHTCSAITVYLVLRSMTGTRWRSALAAALFAMHPLRVESVAWVAERKDVLSVLLGLLALLAYVRYAKSKSVASYVATFVLFALALMAKSMVLTLPFVMLLIDYWPLRRPPRERWRRLVIEKLPLFALSCASATMQIVTASISGALNPEARFPLSARIANAIVSTGQYLLDMIWPTKLAMLYPFSAKPQTLAAVAVGLLLAAITAFCIAGIRRWPHLAVGWFWFLGTLVPVNGLVSIGELARADRYTYFAMIGVILMVVWSIPELTDRTARALAAVGSAAVVIALGAVTHLQLRHWRSSSTIFDHTLWVIGPNATIEMNWGVAHASRGEHEPAARHLQNAWRLIPGNPAVAANLANELQSAGLIEEAIAMYREASRLMPDHPMIWHNLGVAYMRTRRLPEAEQCYRQVLRLRPTFTPARQNLNRVLAAQGKPPE